MQQVVLDALGEARVGLLDLLLPRRVGAARIPRTVLPFGVELEQIVGNVGHRPFGPLLDRLPVERTHPSNNGCLVIRVQNVDNVVVVETKDSVLVADKSHSQDVKKAVDTLKAQNRDETKLHRQVFRPWGSYDSLENADGFQVKQLVIKPGAILSLQKHAHRSEHWVCVRGKARITRNDEEFDLKVNESTYVAIGDVHRIANPYNEPAHIIEVQCGDYLGEDDIVRLEDNYGREGTNT